VDELEELAQKISATSLCEIGKIASAPVLATLEHFGREYEEHIDAGTCRAGKCGLDSQG
jgi:NADH:ubiquinone oxidoreductase subunit F (NADH-binding)